MEDTQREQITLPSLSIFIRNIPKANWEPYVGSAISGLDHSEIVSNDTLMKKRKANMEVVILQL